MLGLELVNEINGVMCLVSFPKCENENIATEYILAGLLLQAQRMGKKAFYCFCLRIKYFIRLLDFYCPVWSRFCIRVSGSFELAGNVLWLTAVDRK